MTRLNLSHFRFFCIVLASAGLCLSISSLVNAQTSYPMLMSLKPVAVQVGTTAECEVQSRYSMLGAYQVSVSGSGVTAEVIEPEPPKDPPKPGDKPRDLTKLKLKFTVTAEALPGVREFRLATPHGASTIGQVVVVRDPVIVESADNNTADKAQVVTLPATLCGAIEKVEDFDFYKFTATAGQSISFHVRCQRLQDKIHDLQAHADPILFLRDTNGGVLAMSDNTFFADPFLTHTFDQAGDYLLEIRDVRYHGNVYWEYCIEANSRPYVTGAFPTAIRAGVQTAIELSGVFLPAEARSSITIPEGTAVGIHFIPLNLGDQQTNPVPFYVTDLPTFAETAADNNSPMSAPVIEVPQVISGRIETEADLDCYSFVAKKGEKFSFEVRARRQMSNLDSFIRILNDKGQSLREDDDGRFGRLTFADTFLEGWEAPADGTFTVEVRDVHLRGGPGFEYVLQITRTMPYFELQLDTDKTLLTPGMSGAIFARVVRKHGFTGEVQLHVNGLPPGVTATCGRILAGKGQDGCIVLTAASDAAMVSSELLVHGTATHPQGDGQPSLALTAVATPYQEYYSPGGGRGHYPVESHMVSVGPPADILSIQLSDTDIVLKPGQSKKILVKLERNKDVNQNVTLDMLYKHLDSVFANSLPEGVTIDGNQSKTLLTGTTSEGEITLKADAKAPPVDKQVGVVMANFAINFVMKATYCSPPVFVTVEKTE
ncbi:MAG: pre-peptidase C-terminal domain-containing protein [Planctomycetes bacterium]|nr:pre-peptidase C-terminal domain-containing protein [Planctomycetota bacterium]